MVKYRDIYSVRLQLHDISLRHASNHRAPQMIKLAVATARLTILDRLVHKQTGTSYHKFTYTHTLVPLLKVSDSKGAFTRHSFWVRHS